VQSSKHILIIDDDEASLNLMRTAFAEIGPKITIRSLKSGADAISFLRGLLGSEETVPDLIITDYRMQPIDGGEICRFLKNTDGLKHVPAIVLTGMAIKADEKEQLPAEHIIIKPPEWNDLVELARQLKHRYLASPGGPVPVLH
jgi:two-component system, OmpR family, phosphate regulon response regulator PhoB